MGIMLDNSYNYTHIILWDLHIKQTLQFTMLSVAAVQFDHILSVVSWNDSCRVSVLVDSALHGS